jgi:two-component system, LytTR family, response regulator
MINAIIIDDEPYCCKVLSTLIERHCNEVNVVGICSSGLAGLKEILDKKPSLVFLDVEMPKMNGFEMLQRLEKIDFNVIFTTSYDKYALKAIRFSAIDYLLKPIDRLELQVAVQKVVERSYTPIAQQFEILLAKINQPSALINKVALPTIEGFQMVPIDSIISCRSESNYTVFLLKDKKRLVASKSLKEIDEILENHFFIRVHHSHLVNLNEVNKYVKGEGGYLLMSDGSTVDVSRGKKDQLLNRLFPKKNSDRD